jgi:hypothetical protein
MPGGGIPLQGAVALKQCLHRQGVVHPPAAAREIAGAGIDIQTVLAIQFFDVGVAKRFRGVFCQRFDDTAVGTAELELLSPRDAHTVSAFVHQAMVKGALCRLPDYADSWAEAP